MHEFEKKNMILLGAGGRNSGKTLLACKIIEQYSQKHFIVGVKITTIRNTDGTCPRGGEGCGVCTSLDGVYCITEELDKTTKKDTSRLLASGARRVFWLRVMKNHLIEGLKALFDVLPEKSAVVCESNSIRTILKPGVFLLVRDKNQKTMKPSARSVQKMADRIVEFDPGMTHDKPFDIDMDDIRFINQNWILRKSATVVR
jgi:molybdopterin-guanine dinucleotide biosynthesis protein